MNLKQENLNALSQLADRCIAHDPSLLSDQDCKDVLKELDEGDFEVSDWEAKFIESCLGRDFFSDKQKKVILRMDERYIRRTN